jgi:hypothetical protein
MDQSDDRTRAPRGEVEILPPGNEERAAPQFRHDIRMTRQHVFVAQPGPVGVALFLLGLGVVAGLGLLIFLGLFLLWIPLVGVALAGIVLSTLLRGPRRL